MISVRSRASETFERTIGNLTTSDISYWIENHIGSLARPRQMARYDGTTDIRRDLFHLVPSDSHKDQETPMNKRLALFFGDWTVAKAFYHELSFFLTGHDTE